MFQEFLFFQFLVEFTRSHSLTGNCEYVGGVYKRASGTDAEVRRHL